MIWDFVWVVIPMTAIIGSFIIKSQRLRMEMARTHAADGQVAQELRDLIHRLEMRVANLERAVTTAETERKYAL
jgi:hypothetical protein